MRSFRCLVCEKYAFSENQQQNPVPKVPCNRTHEQRLRVFSEIFNLHIQSRQGKKNNVKRVGTVYIVEVFTQKEKECVSIKQFLLFIHLCTYCTCKYIAQE